MPNGIADERLFPIMRVNIKREDNEWHEPRLVLNTGFEGGIALAETRPIQGQDAMCSWGVP